MCRLCGSSERIEAHHLEGLAEGGSAFSLDNVLTLCADCHRKESAKAKGGFLSVAVPPEILRIREKNQAGVPRAQRESPGSVNVG
jgi:5-methylcytosine-specific restriction endonuclease McrA